MFNDVIYPVVNKHHKKSIAAENIDPKTHGTGWELICPEIECYDAFSAAGNKREYKREPNSTASPDKEACADFIYEPIAFGNSVLHALTKSCKDSNFQKTHSDWIDRDERSKWLASKEKNNARTDESTQNIKINFLHNFLQV